MNSTKRYDVYGVGNAIVDIVTRVSVDFFVQHEIEQGLMTLVDEQRLMKLTKVIGDDHKKMKMSAGGSAANTVVAISQLGGSAYYSCVVAQDVFGKFFLADLGRNRVDSFLSYKSAQPGHTGRCLIMTDPEAQRTMNTFLGASSLLSPDYISEDAIKQAKWLYMEGYLVSSPLGLETMKVAKQMARKHGVPIALTFSDPSMVKYYSKQMEDIIDGGIDLLFGNEEEVLLYTQTNHVEEAHEKLKNVATHFLITQGPNGAIIYDGNVSIHVEAYPARAVDTNGAGDMFAGAFLYAITQGQDFFNAGRLAVRMAARVVEQFGPRLTPAEVKKIANQEKNVGSDPKKTS